MKTAPKSFSSAEEIKALVKSEEEVFENKLKFVIEELCERAPKFIGLTGPTCAGKTTVSKKLIEYAENHGKRIRVVSLDDFFYDTEHIKLTSYDNLDFDSVKALDLECARDVFEAISKGKTVNMPRFDFKLGKRVEYINYNPLEYDIFLVEGIQVLYPQIYSLFPKNEFCGVFINADSSITVGDSYFDKNEIRLMRRIVRDYYFRNATLELTFALWKGVRENENNSIFPYSDKCEYQINSVLAFEIHILKPYLEKILASADENESYYPRARAIYEKIKDIQAISNDFLPDETVYREFIPM